MFNFSSDIGKYAKEPIKRPEEREMETDAPAEVRKETSIELRDGFSTPRKQGKKGGQNKAKRLS